MGAVAAGLAVRGFAVAFGAHGFSFEDFTRSIATAPNFLGKQTSALMASDD
jgi:hypothetical protein